MNENPNGFGSEDNSGAQSGTEYSYTRESIPHASYVDANYRVQPEAAKTHNATYTAQPLEEKKTKKKGGAGKLIAACLVCALLGGAAGGGIVYAVLPEDDSGTGGSTNLNLSNSAYSGGTTEAPVVDGSLLTPSEIYALGCEQAVGISTEITYSNFLGMKTSAAVSGSGFIVSTDGYIVTNYHVIEDAFKGGYDITVMLYNGETYSATIVGGDEDNDIAVLKIDASGLSAATIGSSDTLQVGDSVYAIGNPLGELSFSMTGGMVSALDREIATGDSYGNATTTNNMFQFDAAINEGNSGGPVYNNRGEVVGIATAKYEDTGVEGLGFAIPTDEITEMIDDLINKGYVSGKAYFGISVDANYDTAAQYYKMVQGAYVSAVTEGSCSEKAGLKVDDVITAMNDTEIKSSSDLQTAKRDYSAGDTVTLKVYRDGEYLSLTVTLDEQQPDSGSSTADESGAGQGGATIAPIPKG